MRYQGTNNIRLLKILFVKKSIPEKNIREKVFWQNRFVKMAFGEIDGRQRVYSI